MESLGHDVNLGGWVYHRALRTWMNDTFWMPSDLENYLAAWCRYGGAFAWWFNSFQFAMRNRSWIMKGDPTTLSVYSIHVHVQSWSSKKELKLPSSKHSTEVPRNQFDDRTIYCSRFRSGGRLPTFDAKKDTSRLYWGHSFFPWGCRVWGSVVGAVSNGFRSPVTWAACF